MAKQIQLRRLIALSALLVLAFSGLGYRLVDLQVIRHNEFAAKAQRMTHHQYLLEPRRGDILDCRGNLLATTELVKTVCADPVMIRGKQAEVARALAPLLQEDEASLYARLLPKTHKNEKGLTVTNMFVELKHRVPVATWTNIQETMRNLCPGLVETNLPRAERPLLHALRAKAVFAQNDQLRIYPNQTLAAHILGYATSEPEEVEDVPVNQIIGQDGIEQQMDEKLAGVRGWRLTETDGQRREQVQWREQDVEPRDGLNVVLTIDSFIQHTVEAALAEGMEKHSPISISSIVVRPRTGEILALATLPTYDPNQAGKFPPEARRNRVVSDIAEPGSVFKIVVVSGALNEGLVDLNDKFDCEQGVFHYAGRALHDHESFSTLSVEQIITKSSNIGAAKIGIKMGEDRLYDYIRRFGFGTVTGIPLPGEVSAGRFVQLSKWTKVSLAQVPMGQGISVTRLQMIMAMSAIANGGKLMQPMIVDRLEDRQRKVVAKYAPHQVRQVISEATARQMVTALKTVVGREGTAPKAAMDHYTVAGKTGTAQKVEHGVYVHGKYFSSFIGFFPADHPELCISVMLDEPKHGYYGGQTAAPIFKQIAERTANYLGIQPEDVDDRGTLAESPGRSNETHLAKAGPVGGKRPTKP